MQKTVPIPKFVIDLSQPPELRYAHIVEEFQSRLDDCDLTGLFHDLLRCLVGRKRGKCLGAVARVAFRRVCREEETAELAGIAKMSGVPMHILVAYNVLLDLLLGCTSGGVRMFDRDETWPAQDASTRMLHFRTLDWGMEQLRQIIVELDFVRFPGGPVVATSVTYLGYVGVLTGVRRGLSMSLNFRPHHSKDSWRQRAAFRWQQAMVVLGKRQSVCSVLRDCLLNPAHVEKQTTRDEKYVEEVKNDYVQAMLSNHSASRSTAAYLIFCTPERVYIVEKDHHSASVRESDTFLTAYNHDASDEVERESSPEATGNESGDANSDIVYSDVAYSDAADTDDTTSVNFIGLDEIIGLSLDRKDCLDSLWKARVQECQLRNQRQDQVVALNDVKLFLEGDYITNEETHYAVIMDPASGKVVWRTAYEVPEDSDGDEDDEDGESQVSM
ncbi:beta subunit of N-acylethanolamine-hydrolyzing acid amidase-domain-containing protein [Dactylonectria estremocensis]|uniref:ceramidase n=1 Tax=Dactylonectria estremocensis TaxID=1079267 RepID=A0A9P9ISJ4_9HYPO|nr:beta subunit of N-acylethanolamine-hydrolyzing acid amidase-domain-containing protein [Dactylonectria estremocensis]